jgi:hypothetical protein
MAVSLPRSQPEQRYSSKKLEGAHNPSLMVGEDKANMIRWLAMDLWTCTASFTGAQHRRGGIDAAVA